MKITQACVATNLLQASRYTSFAHYIYIMSIIYLGLLYTDSEKVFTDSFVSFSLHKILFHDLN